MPTEKQIIAQKYNWMLFQLDGAEGCLRSIRAHIEYVDDLVLTGILQRTKNHIRDTRDTLIAKVDEDERTQLDGAPELLQASLETPRGADGRRTTPISFSHRIDEI